MALESAARVMNGTFGQIWEDGTEIAEVSAFQLKVTNNFDSHQSLPADGRGPETHRREDHRLHDPPQGVHPGGQML